MATVPVIRVKFIAELFYVIGGRWRKINNHHAFREREIGSVTRRDGRGSALRSARF